MRHTASAKVSTTICISCCLCWYWITALIMCKFNITSKPCFFFEWNNIPSRESNLSEGAALLGLITSSAWSRTRGCFSGTLSFPCALYYLIFRGDLRLAHRARLWAVYICSRLKEHHSFIAQTELLCLHSRRASLDSCKQGCIAHASLNNTDACHQNEMASVVPKISWLLLLLTSIPMKPSPK